MEKYDEQGQLLEIVRYRAGWDFYMRELPDGQYELVDLTEPMERT